jgi:RNA polymerase sigma factor (sigma-70 family)
VSHPRQLFEANVLPHLDAAYNLARWLMRNDAAAEDVVQEASMRALRYIATLRGDDARPWLLKIVRNTCFTALGRLRDGPEMVEFDEAEFETAVSSLPSSETDPAALLQAAQTRQRVDAALRALAPALREVVVLREFEDLSYAQIAAIVEVPIGTVMSRLSRARDRLRVVLSETSQGH